MTPLLELADRVEAATGPDRELAEAVLRAVGWHVDAYSQAIKPNGERAFRIPDPLSSVDDAMTLVPEGRHWVRQDQWPIDLGRSTASICKLVEGDNPAVTRVGQAATPALALTAAALRARASHTTT